MTHRSALRLICLPVAAALAGAALAGAAPAHAAPAHAAPAHAAPAHAAPAPAAVAHAASAPAAPAPAAVPVCATEPVTPAPSFVHLTAADDNREICVARGAFVDVTLTVDVNTYPDPGMWWTAVTSSSKILTAVPIPRVPPRGTTIATFRADDLGTSTLWSTQSPCVPRPGWLCPAWLNYWDVKVNVVG